VRIDEELMEIWPNEVCDRVSNICNILIYFSEWRLMRRAFLALAFISEALEVANAILLSV